MFYCGPLVQNFFLCGLLDQNFFLCGPLDQNYMYIFIMLFMPITLLWHTKKKYIQSSMYQHFEKKTKLDIQHVYDKLKRLGSTLSLNGSPNYQYILITLLMSHNSCMNKKMIFDLLCIFVLDYSTWFRTWSPEILNYPFSLKCITMLRSEKFSIYYNIY
jgi:hypothetical protein